MGDVQDIPGNWLVRVKQWTWEYIFKENGTVTWRDINNNEGGAGRWASSGQLINIFWIGSATKESWPFPIIPENQKVWYDAEYAKGWFQATRTIKAAPDDISFDYTVPGKVPNLTQGDAALCWAAGAAMMIAWRRGNPGIRIKEAIDTMGEPYIALLREQGGLTTANYQRLAPDLDSHYMYQQYALAAGMRYEVLRSYTPNQLYQLMVRCRSPLLVITYWDTQWTHALVFKGMWGSSQNAHIVYNDPFKNDEQEDTFKIVMKQMEAATEQVPIQILHY